MTARHQFRIGNRRLGRDRTPIDATPAPPVGETLQAARERKGVDLYRAERDTKIRLRYLSALEDSDYDELPAPVYVKGFLRNYAIYLGLDPDELLDRWHDEMEQMRTATRVAVAPPPMPIVEPGGRRVTITPGMFVAGLVLMVIVAFVGYIGIQFLRFTEVTPVALTYPTNVFSEIDAESVELKGTAGARAIITIRGSGDALYNATADENGDWTREVLLARGRNDFTLSAQDPETGRPSGTVPFAIMVPLPSPSIVPGVSPTPIPSAAPLALTLEAPVPNEVVHGPTVQFRGTTTGQRVTIASTYVGVPGALPTAAPSADPTPNPSPTVAPIGPARDVTITGLGQFDETLSFDPGRWSVVVTAYASGQDPLTETFEITVNPPPPTSITLVMTLEGGDSWVRIVSDGVRHERYGGRQLQEGETHTVTAQNEMCFRAADLGAVHLVLNGVDIGFLGEAGQDGSWQLVLNQAPVPAPVPCT